MAGFTLLEAIVTLVIVSLIVAVLMQALLQSLKMRERLIRYQRESRMETLQEPWFRETVAAAVVDLPDALGGFEGDREQFEFVSAAPLTGAGMQRVRWWLAPGSSGYALHYADRAFGDAVVIEGPLRDAAFSFRGRTGEWLPVWRPADDDPERLPRLVRFEAETGTGRILWIASIAADPELPPLLRLRETVGAP